MLIFLATDSTGSTERMCYTVEGYINDLVARTIPCFLSSLFSPFFLFFFLFLFPFLLFFFLLFLFYFFLNVGSELEPFTHSLVRKRLD